jgi:hypothetical protein
MIRYETRCPGQVCQGTGHGGHAAVILHGQKVRCEIWCPLAREGHGAGHAAIILDHGQCMGGIVHANTQERAHEHWQPALHSAHAAPSAAATWAQYSRYYLRVLWIRKSSSTTMFDTIVRLAHTRGPTRGPACARPLSFLSNGKMSWREA